MINKIVEVLQFNNLKLIPCTEKDILVIEKKYGFKLPMTYRIFLKIMGKGAGNFMKGSFWMYDDLQLINEDAYSLLEANTFRELPDNAFVFWMHQGYQFAFFIFGEGDDPPVYYYNETMRLEDFIKSFDKLSEFYYTELLESLNMKV